jgi:hypothetical protein
MSDINPASSPPSEGTQTSEGSEEATQLQTAQVDAESSAPSSAAAPSTKASAAESDTVEQFNGADSMPSTCGPNVGGKPTSDPGIPVAAMKMRASNPADSIKKARTEFEDAKAGAEKCDRHLNDDLEWLGSASDEVRAKYVQEFHAKHADVYQRASAAEERLATLASDPRLDQVAARDPNAAQEILQSQQDLAHTSHAEIALQWANRLHENPCSLTAKQYAQFEPDLESKLASDIVAPGLASLLGSAASQSGGDAAAMLKTILGYTKPFLSLTKKVGAILQKSTEAFEDVEGAMNKAVAGKPEALSKLCKKFDDFGPVMKSLMVGGVVIGSISAGENAKDGHYLAMAKDIVRTGKEGMELMAYATRSMADSGKLALKLGSASATALKGADLAARLAPVVGVGANALAAASHAKDAYDQHSVALGLAAVGDAVAMAGDLMGNDAIAATGLFFSAGCDLAHGGAIWAERYGERRELLSHFGYEPVTAGGKLMLIKGGNVSVDGKPAAIGDVVPQTSSRKSDEEYLEKLRLRWNL